jgi:hypothetical protein
VSVGFDRGVSVGCGGRVSVSGSSVTGGLSFEERKAQADRSRVKMAIVIKIVKRFAIL